MRSLLLHLKKLDWILITSVLFLMGFGLLSLYSSSLGYSSTGEALGKGDFFNFQKQLFFAGLGILLIFLLSFFNYKILRNDPYLILIIYFFCILALIGLFFFAPEIRGVKSWYRVGIFSFEPIELAKLALIILLAKYFSIRHVELYRIFHILFSGLYLLALAALTFLQPDLGSVLVLVILWLAILIISGIKIKPFLALALCGLLILVVGWQFLIKDYQKERVLSFIEPQLEPLGAGWSQAQSKIAIGSGGIFGQGLGQGSQTQYGFLPEPQTDFIFSAIGEEFGLFGVVVLLSLFSILIFRIIKIALISESNFPRLFAVGLAVLILSQVFINIGMNLGLLPIVGISLPLVSYGGSGLLVICIGLGLLQSIKINR